MKKINALVAAALIATGGLWADAAATVKAKPKPAHAKTPVGPAAKKKIKKAKKPKRAQRAPMKKKKKPTPAPAVDPANP